MTGGAQRRLGPAVRLGARIARTWRGEVPLPRLFLVDMLAWGTILNLASGAVGLILFANDAPGWLAVAAWTCFWPWNAVLCIGVWRASRRRDGFLADVAGPAATVWVLGVAMV